MNQLITATVLEMNDRLFAATPQGLFEIDEQTCLEVGDRILITIDDPSDQFCHLQRLVE